jgi:hypothetical protein
MPALINTIRSVTFSPESCARRYRTIAQESCQLPHDDFAGPVPIPLERKIGIDRIGRILAGDCKQDADSSDKRVSKSELNCRFDPDDGGTVDGSAIDCMTVSPPGSCMYRDEFQVVG